MKTRPSGSTSDELSVLLSQIGHADVDHDDLWLQICDNLDRWPDKALLDSALPDVRHCLTRWPADSERRLPHAWHLRSFRGEPLPCIPLCTEVNLSQEAINTLRDDEADLPPNDGESLDELLHHGLGLGLPALDLTDAIEPIDDSDLKRALAALATPKADALLRLRLPYNNLGGPRLAWLLRLPTLSQLTLLDLSGNDLSDEDVQALTNAIDPTSPLAILALEDNESLGLEALEALLTPGRLPLLRDLTFNGTALAAATEEATEDSPEGFIDLQIDLAPDAYDRFREIIRDIDLDEVEARALHIDRGTLEAYLRLKKRIQTTPLSPQRKKDALALLRQSDPQRLEDLLDDADEADSDAPVLLDDTGAQDSDAFGDDDDAHDDAFGGDDDGAWEE